MEVSAKSDSELVKEVRKGNQNSFEELISRYSHKAFGLATRLTGSREDAEEVLQDVFITVFKKIDGFEEKSSFSSWLYRITVNSALMKIRKKRQQRVTHLEDLEPHEKERLYNLHDNSLALDEQSLQKELQIVIIEAISHLPAEYRPVFVLRDVDGLSTKQVGKILNLTAPAVKSRLHRSRMILRRRLRAIYREIGLGESTADAA